MSQLTVKNVCQLAGISRTTLYKYINNGTISAVKDGKNVYIETSELIRVFPHAKLNDNKNNLHNVQTLTTEIMCKDNIIQMLKQQLNEKQQDNDFLKKQLTFINENFAALNKFIESKQLYLLENKPSKRKKFLGLF